MVLEKQDSGISLATTSDSGEIFRSDSVSDCGDLHWEMDSVFMNGEEDDEEPVKAHKKVCCALCR